jgi:hypothetical protein
MSGLVFLPEQKLGSMTLAGVVAAFTLDTGPGSAGSRF